MVLPQDIFIALALAVGIFGCIIQILPGTLIVAGALLVWAILTQGFTAWLVFGLALAVLVAAAFIKYLLAGKYLKRHEVPNSAVLTGLVVGTVGFFVLPVIGLPLGFIGGIYLFQLARTKKHSLAWAATLAALRATGLTIVIELGGALVATGIWIVGLLIT